ncbi:VWA domain-containing protein [Streptomyces sp. NBC_01142]|uniref:vWA domain-containing protein n=1 Tax=Streptomyces sp. NBC_01142 TaxID=2975865 RepID=UPI00224DCA7D|nr:VWA domain-containing protein [Streptomyces sp. NBC_01142]MCX4822173.1 VWA domain-containing protein [Streptomyces sp. NBC_01142]
MSETQETAAGFRSKGLPAYVVLDTSGSMKPYEQLLNATLLKIYDTLYTSPQLSEFIHLSVLSFNTRPHVVTAMTDIEALESLPTVTCEGLTNLGPMLQVLRDRIADDVRELSQAGTQVLRPVVFLLTDGAPTDKPSGAWQQDLDRLVDPAFKPRPNIITYGFGAASEAVLRTVATVAAYLAEDDAQSTGDALSEAMSSLLNSLVASARVQKLQVPEEVKGYRSVPLDFVD